MEETCPKIQNIRKTLSETLEQIKLYCSYNKTSDASTKEDMICINNIAWEIISTLYSFINPDIKDNIEAAPTAKSSNNNMQEILQNTEDYAVATYAVCDDLKEQMNKLTDQVEAIRCLIKDDYPVVQRTTDTIPNDINNLIVTTITNCLQHLSINIKHSETRSESIHIIEKQYK